MNRKSAKEAGAIWAFTVVFAFFLGMWYSQAIRAILWGYIPWPHLLLFIVDILQFIALGVFLILVYFHFEED